MKKIRFLALIGVILVSTTLIGCNKSNNEEIIDENKEGELIIEDVSGDNNAAINYNDELVEVASKCIISEDNIRDIYKNAESSIEDIQTAVNNTITICTDTKQDIESLGGWEGDDSLKNGVINIIEKYITYYSKFSELLPYIGEEEVTEEQNETYNSLLAEIENLDKELDAANNNLISIQEVFARNHGFELENNTEAAE